MSTGRGWSSQLVEVLRPGRDTGHNLAEEYIVNYDDDRRGTVRVPLTPEELLDWRDHYRYVSPDVPSALSSKVAETVSDMLDVNLDGKSSPHQVDLVFSAKEVAALPFELANARDGRLLLVDREPCVVLTRRVRGEFQERPVVWPTTPHVLVVASAARQAIPLQSHLDALHAALEPWIAPLEGVPDLIPDPRNVLDVLEDATLDDVKRKCAEASRPYTHVHVLAHGVEARPGERLEFGLELNAPGGGSAVVSGEELAAALCTHGQAPSVVTLTACDSGNVGSTVVSSASVAHAIHAAGIPVVLASQIPLTFAGSAIAVEQFYGSLCAGTDVREALRATRAALYDARAQTRNDWGALVAYVRLPEGYADQLPDVRLAAALASLETANAYADHVMLVGASARGLETVAKRLDERIDQLIGWAEEAEEHGHLGALEECRALVGSAHKRLAEVLFNRGSCETNAAEWHERSRSALREALCWYARAYEDNMSAHGPGVQALALEAVLDGRIAEPWRWSATLQAALTAAKADTEVWAWGSLAELYMLAPYAGEPPQLDAAGQALDELLRRARRREDAFAQLSTLRQFRRYTDWWTAANGFFDGDAPASAAEQLLAGATLSD